MKQIILNLILDNFLPLQVILPITLALTLIFFKKPKISIYLTIFYLFICLLISIILFITIYSHVSQNVTYLFGKFEPIIGIEYKIDSVISLMLVLTSLISLIGYFWGERLLYLEIGANKIHFFNILYLIFYSGLLGILLTNDLFNIFIFTELTAISSYALIGLNKSSKSSPLTAFNYLILSSIGTSLYVLGVGIIYMIIGNLNIDIVANKILTVNHPALIMAVIFIILFIIIKIGILPFSAWVPKVYNDTPFTLNPLISGISSKIILFAFIKIVLIILPNIGYEKTHLIILVLNILAGATIVLSSIIAIFQNNLKKILAWSSVCYMGYIFLVIFEEQKTVIIAALLLIIWHSITKTGLFMVAGNIKYMLGNTELNNLSGLNKLSLFNFIAFVVLGLNLIGIPGTFGFTVKFYLVLELLSNNLIWSAIIIILSSVISIFYIWKVIEKCIFSENSRASFPNPTPTKKVYLHMNIILLFLMTIIIILGLVSNHFIMFIYNMINSTINFL